MKKLGLAAFCLALMLMGEACALRPRYADFVSPATTGEKLSLMVVDAKTDAPLPGVKVEFGEGKSRFATTTGADGVISIPVDKKYLDDNSIITVNPPKGQGRTRLVVAPAPVKVEPVVVPEAAPVVDVQDAGSAEIKN